jgi:Fe-S cluster assembly iron-binding protein IscA
MDEKIKIRISESAYDKMLSMLNNEEDKLYIRFSFKDGCCGSNKLDLSIDSLRSDDSVEKIDNLEIIYDKLVTENFKEITIVYRNDSFMVKTVMKKAKDCSTCTVGCGNKGDCSAGCSKCNKLA